ncbi:MAG: type IX secretion system membrane protein PorP/SprF, partial [Bacteroidetes bacterium]|nr:type IX secretion system membrane protein PorP/SprF [Bacteroidota bacterium]
MKLFLQHIAHFRLSIACFFFFVNCQLFPSIWINCFSQDPQFSQFYAAPLYLNPALTGTTPFARLVVNARNQWKKNVNRFDARSVSLDINVKKLHGFGFLATRSYAGVDKQWYDAIGIGPSVKLQSQTNLGFLYSYTVQIARHWYARGGLNFSYTFRSYNFDLLEFRDQYQIDGTILSKSVENRGREKKRYFDLISNPNLITTVDGTNKSIDIECISKQTAISLIIQVFPKLWNFFRGIIELSPEQKG